jgi:hypothetical protein
MIIKSIADLITHVGGVLQGKDFGDIKPSVEWAEEEMLIPAIGQEMYDLLESYLEDGSGSGSASASGSGSGSGSATSYQDALKLAPKCARVVAHFAMFDYTTISDSKVTAQGLQIVETNTHKTAYEYQKRDRKKYHGEKADKALDSLLLFLENNKTKYPEWANNAAVYTETRKLIINNTQQFNECVDIGGSRRTYMTLRGFIKDVEQMHVLPALGVTIYQALKSHILSGGNSANYKQLHDLLVPAVANMAIADALPSIIFRIAGDTITTATYNPFSEKEKEQITKTVNSIIASRLQKGANYLKLAVDFVKATPDLFAISPYAATTEAEGGYNNSEDKKHFVGF